MNGKLEEGKALVNRIREQMAREGKTVSNLAGVFGVSQSYLSQLLRGDKKINATSDKFVRSVAAYLHLPPVVCFVFAGRLGVNDFSTADDEVRAFERALTAVADSSFALEAGVDLIALTASPANVQQLVVRLYAALSGNGEVFPSAEHWSWVLSKSQRS